MLFRSSWRNAKNVKWDPYDFINAAMAGIGDGKNGGGPIWAIFDADAAAREQWTTEPPWVDVKNGFFFSANSIRELAAKIQMKYQRVPMPPEALEETVARYNGFVEKGMDEDFEKPTPKYKIAKPPFYAAWSTPVIHDTRAGLRINANCQVMDFDGQTIDRLYCGGESAGGFSMHGLARCLCQGYIAGGQAAAEVRAQDERQGQCRRQQASTRQRHHQKHHGQARMREPREGSTDRQSKQGGSRHQGSGVEARRCGLPRW